MNLLSWGNYPKINSQAFNFKSVSALKKILKQYNDLIPRGHGRSYGDSALNNKVIPVRPRDLFLNFNADSGELHVQAGVLLSEILDAFVPRGWFLKVSPGTKLVTVGGAIASDVHGKNHHNAGCFSESVVMFKLMLPSGEIMECSNSKNVELFRATCGGMGLTGVILEAKIQLKKINSKYLQQTTIKTRNLEETFAAFEQHQHKTYSVAWIDCLAKGDQVGKCLLMVGEFCDDGQLDYESRKGPTIPFDFPVWLLNTYTVKAFNWLYYHKVRQRLSRQFVDIDSFFFPLDALGHWNRIYGKNGFTQYQFILPKATSLQGLEEILQEIAKSGLGSFLAVLKLYGQENKNYLSFPLEGYSLALDFKIEKGLFSLLDKLDDIVVKHKGRIYLAKDVRVCQGVFEQGYPLVGKFRSLRKKYHMQEKFNSLQSKRIGI